MGLFSKHDSEPTPAEPAPARNSTDSSPRRSFFGGSKHGRDSTSPDGVRRSPTASTHTSTSTQSNRNFLHRLGMEKEDPSITAARERVLSAEQAEREADRALVEARTAVKNAREHVKALEIEAAEQARLAKIKQRQAADISKRGAALGRHGT